MSFLRTTLASAPRAASFAVTRAGSSATTSRLAAASSIRALSTSVSPRSTLLSSRTRLPRTPAAPQHQQHRNLSSDTRTKLDTLTKSSPLVLFMKGNPEMPMCGFSRAVVQILDVQGVNLRKVTAVNVLEDEEVRHGVKEYSDWPTIPQVYVGGEFVGGCDIMLSMHQSGELEELLVKNGLITSPDQPPAAEAPAQQS
ncbi:unnamed protein product [Tilletia controversa]|uniref:Monothiol glutaredoxin-5, mitochondrial n=2 Tax=Tilletia TaxID=13289 RepID=A0A177VC27_9BASI|nr:hypothetical protein CF336_g1296 [Tilletia laevis]KAE8261904.1 hypothetical protein A4X03_0g2879 [Tilletia caries]CAD6958431.1 unnamed protein product [Tilletia controversa]KAE8207947.1 hypothetical protein CF335_g771 [Tilletia laevis]CAD6893343.1 unnamed protein product [Tilletia caries]